MTVCNSRYHGTDRSRLGSFDELIECRSLVALLWCSGRHSICSAPGVDFSSWARSHDRAMALPRKSIHRSVAVFIFACSSRKGKGPVEPGLRKAARWTSLGCRPLITYAEASRQLFGFFLTYMRTLD
jgi:hypothetical protein